MKTFHVFYVPGSGWGTSLNNLNESDKFVSYIEERYSSFASWSSRLVPCLHYHFVEFNNFDEFRFLGTSNPRFYSMTPASAEQCVLP